MYRLAIFFTCVFSPFCLQPSELHKNYSASYKLSAKNVEIGLIERTFSIEDNSNYRFLSTISTVGLGRLLSSLSRSQISTGKFTGGRFVPTDYSYQSANKKRSYELKLNQPDVGITKSGLKSPQKPVLLDQLSYQAQLQADLLNEVNSYEYLVQKRNKQKLYAFQHDKTELIITKLGQFMCKKMIRLTDSPGKSITIWVAEKLHYVPVKIELLAKGKKTVAILTKLSHAQ